MHGRISRYIKIHQDTSRSSWQYRVSNKISKIQRGTVEEHRFEGHAGKRMAKVNANIE